MLSGSISFLEKIKRSIEAEVNEMQLLKIVTSLHNSVTLDIRSYLGAPAIHIYEQYSGSSFQDFFAPRNLNNFQTQQDKIRNNITEEEKENVDWSYFVV